MAAVLLAPLAWADTDDDLVELEALLLRAHPALHRFVAPDVLAARFAAARAAAPSTEWEVARELHTTLALIGDAHIAIAMPSMQPQGPPVSLIPLIPRTVDGAVHADAGPGPGELLAIDGRPISEVYASLLPLVAVDGREPEAALRHLEHRFPGYYAIGFGPSSQYRVTVRGADGLPVGHTLDGADRAALPALQASRRGLAWGGPPPSGDGAVLLRDPHVGAVLQLPTFGLLDHAGFAAVVDAAMRTVDPEEPLTIDLRGNEGGFRVNSFAVLRHLLAAPWTEWTSAHATFRRLPASLRAVVRFPFGGDDWLRAGLRGSRDRDGWTLLGDPLAATATPAPITHTGPIRVLVDGRTGSAANGFALVLRAAHPQALLVGERLGGACDRHVGEVPVVWTAATSGLRVVFSVVELTHAPSPGCEPGTGLAPDIRVRPSADDLARGVDPWLAAAW